VRRADRPFHTRGFFEAAFCVDRFFREDASSGNSLSAGDDQIVRDHVACVTGSVSSSLFFCWIRRRTFVVLDGSQASHPRQLTRDTQLVVVGLFFLGKWSSELRNKSEEGLAPLSNSKHSGGMPPLPDLFYLIGSNSTAARYHCTVSSISFFVVESRDARA
jgi:hypothetical protein